MARQEMPRGELIGTTNALADLASDQLDPRLGQLISTLLTVGDISVRLVKSGHPLGAVTPGGRVNDH